MSRLVSVMGTCQEGQVKTFTGYPEFSLVLFTPSEEADWLLGSALASDQEPLEMLSWEN